MSQPSEKSFHETFFDDAIISPADRRILLFEVHILDRIGAESEHFRQQLDSLPLPGVIELLARHGCDLEIVSMKEK